MGKKHNLTTLIGLPLLGWKREMYDPYLINAYIEHDVVDRFDKSSHIHILLNWSVDERFKKLESTLKNSKLCVSQYDPDKEGVFVVFIMRIPKATVKDYQKFLAGKYSELSDRSKTMIMASTKPGGIIYRILYKEESLKKELEEKIGVDLNTSSEIYSSMEDSILKKKQILTNETLEELLVK